MLFCITLCLYMYVRLLLYWGKRDSPWAGMGKVGQSIKYTLNNVICSFDILKYITGESGRLLWYDWTAMGKVGQLINLRPK